MRDYGIYPNGRKHIFTLAATATGTTISFGPPSTHFSAATHFTLLSERRDMSAFWAEVRRLKERPAEIEAEINGLSRKRNEIHLDVSWGHPSPEKIAEMRQIDDRIRDLKSERETILGLRQSDRTAF